MKSVRVSCDFGVAKYRDLTVNVEFSSSKCCDPSKFEMYNKEYFEVGPNTESKECFELRTKTITST